MANPGSFVGAGSNANNKPPNQTEEAKRQLDAAYQQYLGRQGGDDEYLSHLGGGRNVAQKNIDYAINNIRNSAEAAAYAARTRTGDNPGAYPGEGGTVIPPDLYGLRNTLGGYLMDNLLNWAPTPFPGELNLSPDALYGDAADWFNKAGAAAEEGFKKAEDSMGGLYRMADTGGAPDITAALEAIRQKGMMDIEDQSAQIRERFGGWGLGQSSDVTEYLGRGVSRGIADINQQQSLLTATVMSAAADRKLSASTAIPGMHAQLAAGRGNVASQVGQGLLSVGQANMSVKENNLTRQYAEFVRMQQINPYLEPSINFATSFAPVRPAIPMQGGGSDWMSAAIGAAGSIAPYLMLLSDRDAKEDIKPMSSDIAAGLASLPIYEWQYKGEKTRHLGPMAQDFQEKFGVGDGKTIHLVDVVGVLLASQKSMMERLDAART